MHYVIHVNTMQGVNIEQKSNVSIETLKHPGSEDTGMSDAHISFISFGWGAVPGNGPLLWSLLDHHTDPPALLFFPEEMES